MGKIIGAVLLSYDIEGNKHDEVKKKLWDFGYRVSWNRYSDENYFLPDTTMLHLNKSCDAAISDLQQICKELSAKLIRSVAVLAADISTSEKQNLVSLI